MEKDKEGRICDGKSEDVAKMILLEEEDDLRNKKYHVLTNAQLDVFFKWHTVPKEKNDKKDLKVARESGRKESSLPLSKSGLQKMSKSEEVKKMDFTMSATALGWLQNMKKREIVATGQSMNQEECKF